MRSAVEDDGECAAMRAMMPCMSVSGVHTPYEVHEAPDRPADMFDVPSVSGDVVAAGVPRDCRKSARMSESPEPEDGVCIDAGESPDTIAPDNGEGPVMTRPLLRNSRRGSCGASILLGFSREVIQRAGGCASTPCVRLRAYRLGMPSAIGRSRTRSSQ